MYGFFSLLYNYNCEKIISEILGCIVVLMGKFKPENVKMILAVQSSLNEAMHSKLSIDQSLIAFSSSQQPYDTNIGPLVVENISMLDSWPFNRLTRAPGKNLIKENLLYEL